MYRSVAALFLLIVMAFSQGASADVYESTTASGHALLANQHTDYLQPYVALSQLVTSAAFVKLPTTKFSDLHAILLDEEATLAATHFVSLSESSDHNKRWITKVAALLYPAHEFS